MDLNLQSARSVTSKSAQSYTWKQANSQQRNGPLPRNLNYCVRKLVAAKIVIKLK